MVPIYPVPMPRVRFVHHTDFHFVNGSLPGRIAGGAKGDIETGPKGNLRSTYIARERPGMKKPH